VSVLKEAVQRGVDNTLKLAFRRHAGTATVRTRNQTGCPPCAPLSHPGCEASFPDPPCRAPPENVSRYADEIATDDSQASCRAKNRSQRNPTAGRVERRRICEPPLVSGALGRTHSPDERSVSEAAVCDRLAVFHSGSIADILDGKTATEEQILRLAISGKETK